MVRVFWLFVCVLFFSGRVSFSMGGEVVNSLGMRFLTVSEGVLLCEHATRRKDFAAYVAAGGLGVAEPFFEQGEDHPVVNVSWEDAGRFCEWLTLYERSEGAIGANQYYRLPTEAEWLMAAGLEAEAMTAANNYGSRQLVFEWGDAWPPPFGSGNFGPNLGVDGFAYTSPVASFSPNARGFYDLSGNVWEWCADTFEGAFDMRVLKGGSWRMDEPSRVALNKRIGNACGLRLPTYGFRVLFVADEAAE